jgi:hypothetical protein
VNPPPFQTKRAETISGEAKHHRQQQQHQLKKEKDDRQKGKKKVRMCRRWAIGIKK